MLFLFHPQASNQPFTPDFVFLRAAHKNLNFVFISLKRPKKTMRLPTKRDEQNRFLESSHGHEALRLSLQRDAGAT